MSMYGRLKMFELDMMAGLFVSLFPPLERVEKKSIRSGSADEQEPRSRPPPPPHSCLFFQNSPHGLSVVQSLSLGDGQCAYAPTYL
jgi:hypothetical protein